MHRERLESAVETIIRLCVLFGALGVLSAAAPAGGAPPPGEGRSDEPSAGASALGQRLREEGIAGGLVVHLGCGDGRGSAALLMGDHGLVQGLGSDRREIERARDRARSLGLDGRLSFKHWQGGQLPYANDLVNVLVWEESARDADRTEIVRVLAPGGVAFIASDGGWERLVKPWPDDIDEWTHFRYDAGGGGASHDRRAGPPHQIQWEAGPRFMRSHEIETGLSGLVSAGGRLYYIIDDGPIGITDARFPARWSLVCRDAFNGVLLWRRPLAEWGWQAWSGEERVNDPNTWLGLRTRPADVDRLMAAEGDRLYVTLGTGAPVSALDGSTGERLRTYEGTAGAAELLSAGGLLLVREERPRPAVTCLRAADGEVLWRREAGLIISRSLAAAGERVFYHDRTGVVALDLATGEELWRHETELRPGAVIAHPAAVLVVHSQATLAFAPATGAPLWRGPGVQLRGRNPDLFVTDHRVWMGRPQFQARDITTGEVVHELDPQQVLESGHHRRCYADRATACYIITGERGSEFLDLTGSDHTRHNWLRGPCIHGMVPANGLFYVPPHQCFCYPAVRMDGFFALSPENGNSPSPNPGSSPPRLEEGPAFGQPLPAPQAGDGEWPTYRQNARRGGSVEVEVAMPIEELWSRQFGGRLTQPVAAGGRVVVAQRNAGTVHCLDFDSGEPLWSRTVAGPIDSPPSIHGDLVLFGSRDGFVYCLRAGDGEQVWQFRAAPEDRQIVSYGRLESAWPVHGSVLLLDGVVYGAAGRSGFLEGGIYLFALHPASGRLLHEARLEGPQPDIHKASYAFHKDGHRADVLTTDGQFIYMGRTALDRSLQVVETERVALVGTQRGDELEYRVMPGMRLVATGGLLDDTFWNRTWWMHSYVWPSFHYAQQAPKSGQMLVFDDEKTFSVKHFTTRNRHSPMLFPGSGYLLFADENANEPLFYRGEGEPAPVAWEPELPEETRWSIHQDAAVDKGPGFTRAQPALWTSWVDVRVEAMVLAGEKLFVAGPPDLVPEDDPLAALEGRMGGVLKAVRAADGSPLAEYPLRSKPVFDGLISAGGRLVMSTQEGSVVSMGASDAR